MARGFIWPTSMATSRFSALTRTTKSRRCFPFRCRRPTRRCARRKFPPASPFRRTAKNFTSRAIFPIASSNSTPRREKSCGPGTSALRRLMSFSAGNKIYVSNWGGRRPDADSLTGPAGNGMRVRVDARSIASEGSVSVIDLNSSATSAGNSRTRCRDARSRPNSDRPARLRAGVVAERPLAGRRQRGQRHVERD